MQLLIDYHLGMIFFAILLSLFVLFPCILLMHFLMPRQVLSRYWCMPHFRPTELVLLTGTIYAPLRTVMLMAAIAFPALGRRRNVAEAFALTPSWYRVASKVICIWIICATTGGITITLLGFIVGYATGDPVPLRRGG